MIPSGADAEHQATAREQVDLGGLLGDERGLPLGQDEDAGGELDRGRVGGEEPEQHERLVERIVLRVRAAQRGVTIGVVDAEHVVVRGEPDAAE